MAESYIDAPPPGPLADALATARSRLRRYLDAAAPHVGPRWAGLALGVLAYGARVYTLKGFHIVTYALAIYNLNLLLGFLTPQVRLCGWGGGKTGAAARLFPLRKKTTCDARFFSDTRTPDQPTHPFTHTP